jgi:hypothetical protein
MCETYYMPLAKVKIDEYEKIIESKDLLPGRKILKEDITDRFIRIRSTGIDNLEELIEALKNKNKMEKFAFETGLTYDYLIILKREINSYQPKPVYLKKFPGFNQEYLEQLSLHKIKNSKQLFLIIKNKADLWKLSEQTNIPCNDLLELFKLSDLVRINGVGPVFARMMFEIGVDGTFKMANSSSKSLYNKLTKLNIEKNYTKAKFTIKDIEFCIDFAKKLPKKC